MLTLKKEIMYLLIQRILEKTPMCCNYNSEPVCRNMEFRGHSCSFYVAMNNKFRLRGSDNSICRAVTWTSFHVVPRLSFHIEIANSFDNPVYFIAFGLCLLIKVTSKTPNRLIHMWMLPKMFSKGEGLWPYIPLNPLPLTYHYLLCMAYGWTMEIGKQTAIQKSHVKGDCGASELTVGQTFFLIRRPLLQGCCLHSYIPGHGSLFVYLVYVGSPRRCHQSERWEKCPFDTLTIVEGGGKKKKRRKEN